MNNTILAPKADAAVIRSIVCASLFVLAGLMWPVLSFIGETREPDVLLGPLTLNGATFLIAHVFACVGLGQGRDASMAEGKRVIRSIWGISVVMYALTV